MQLYPEERQVLTQGVRACSNFGMKAENSAHIFGILRNQLYSNKILAVLREYSANAWDEHQAAGIPDRPIKVVIPTELEPTLRVRDFGRGLSEEQVFEIYTQYGSSTKRDTNLTVGALGIGCKSAFAYSDAFTVTSWYGGEKSVYQAALDETNVGTMSLLWREPCSPDETGIEISLAVSVKDCAKFQKEAQNFFRFFSPFPEINTPLSPTPQERFPEGDVWGYGGSWVAVMGCVPYPIEITQILDDLVSQNLGDLNSCYGVVRFDIGEVSISASREGLEYTARTREALIRKFKILRQKALEDLTCKLQDETLSGWDRRLFALSHLGFGSKGKFTDKIVPLNFPEFGVRHPDLNLPLSLRSFSTYAPTVPRERRTIDVSKEVRLIVRDLNRKPQDFGVTQNDFVLYPTKPNLDWKDVLSRLGKLLKCLDLDGIPVVLMSSLKENSKAAPRVRTTPATKEKHFVIKPQMFTLGVNHVPSKNWQSLEHTPSDQDLYLILENFRPRFQGSEYGLYELMHDYQDFTWLGASNFPKVVGYRTSVQNPVDKLLLLGQEYPVWRVKAFQDLVQSNPSKQELLLARALTRSSSLVNDYKWGGNWQKLLDNLGKHLGLSHPLTVYVLELSRAYKQLLAVPTNTLPTMDRIDATLNLRDYVKTLHLNALKSKYPLFSRRVSQGPGMQVLLSENNFQVWVDYVRMVDSTFQNPANLKENP